MFKEARQVFKIVHEAHEFLQVFKPRLGLRALVGLPHRGVAGFIQDQFGQLGVTHSVNLRAPALKRPDNIK